MKLTSVNDSLMDHTAFSGLYKPFSSPCSGVDNSVNH